MRWRQTVAALALIASVGTALAENPALDTFIEAELPGSAAPGLAYAVLEDGAVTAKGFGERLRGSGDAVTSDTRFPIGSVSKSFTALAIMQLVEAGVLDLEDPVSRHLPVFADGPAAEVTLRQLLNHTSGYSTVQGNRLHGGTDDAQLDLVAYAGQLARVEPVHPPGAVWQYSNANYQILGAVIEQASGERYPDYIEARIFAPLGMSHSSARIGPSSADIATGHRPWFGSVRPGPSDAGLRVHAPAGGIVSTAHDMGLYLAMWANGVDDIVSADTKAKMLRPSGPASLHYGLGWSLDTAQGTAYHTGLVPGFETLCSFRPTEGEGVVVMVNANSGLGFADTWYLIGGAGARALYEDHDDDGSRWGPKAAYLTIAALPPMFALFAFGSWRGRAALRAKRESAAGRLSLWFPLVGMVALAWVLLKVVPGLFGGSIATMQLYQPDFAWCLIAAAILAPAWAVQRLALAYMREPGRAPTG